MTKKELDIFIEHLLQVWKPRGPSTWRFLPLDYPWPGSFLDDNECAILGEIQIEDRLTIIFGRFWWTLQYWNEQWFPPATLRINIRETNIVTKWDPRPKVLSEIDARYINADGHFNSKWHLFFRRSCWLSGIKIECSAEERAQWVQGYTYRQIDEWNSILLGDERHHSSII